MRQISSFMSEISDEFKIVVIDAIKSLSYAANVLAREKGATLFRVHDVRANREALEVADAVLRA